MAKRSLRRSQAVVPFGVGAMIDFPGESLIAAGLDVWPREPRGVLVDERLARQLGVSYFREPPSSEGEGPTAVLPFLRFPEWHFCPRCRRLARVSPHDLRTPKCSSDSGSKTLKQPCCKLPQYKRRRLIPLRFIAACPGGHLEDFPWVEWAHSKQQGEIVRGASCGEPRIHLYATGSVGLIGLVVTCETCGQKRSLQQAASPDGIPGLSCEGRRPWLEVGDMDPESCGRPLRMLQRGATNVYFARVASSILIPPYSSRLRQIVNDPAVWGLLTSGVGEDGKPHPERVKMIAEMRGVDPGGFAAEVKARLVRETDETAVQSDLDYRQDEYRALLSRTPRPDDLLVLAPQAIGGDESVIGEFFADIVLVEKLAETRVLTGFTRVQPPDTITPVQWNRLALQPRRWLPAFRVFGEGIFLTLRRDAVSRWAEGVGDALAILHRRHNKVAEERGRPTRHIPAGYILLHTLSHLLIRRLSFECGYGASALRERLYCRIPDDAYESEGKENTDNWMCGVLIYTAAGDAEGTLGGLVRQGKPSRLETILKNALSEAWWCASDPLCRESAGQGPDSLNLAACHACALLPETSCEEGNRLLDRLTLIGGPDDRCAGFFSKLVESLGAA